MGLLLDLDDRYDARVIDSVGPRHFLCPFRPSIFALLLSASWSNFGGFSQPESGLDHPAIREVLAMVEAGVGEEVIVARIQQMEDLPSLSGEEIAELKRKGVSDRLLLVLVQGERAEAEESTTGAAKLRVVLEASFPVSYFEVAVNSHIVATRGRRYEGLSEPGRPLGQPRRFLFEESEIAYEEAIEPGEYEILVGFEVARVEGDPRDDWMEYSRQQYVSSGVEAKEGPGPARGWGGNQAAICRVGEGQVCVVTARFGRTPPTRFGGLPVYSLTYEVEVSPEY